MGTLTVVTGMPGTRIRKSLDKFARFSSSSHHRPVAVFSLEEALQRRAQPLVTQFFPVQVATVVETFLLPRAQLRRVWAEAWAEVLEQVDATLPDSDVVLTFHLAYFHQLTREYFVAADMPVLVEALQDRAARIVTFIDDIYDCHQSLIAGGSAAGMMPPPDSIERAILDLMQVLDWRSIEVMLSESLAASTKLPHYIFAVKHPLDTLYDLLFSEKRVIYFSHPISEPRRLHTAGQEQAAREFVQKMAQIVARLQADSTVIEPTTIDELRFRSDSGNLLERWPFQQDTRDLLFVAPEACPQAALPFLFPAEWTSDSRPEISSGLIQSLTKAIQEQIDARDHGLVEQSRFVACYRPIYEGNASRGVQEELLHFARLVTLGLRAAEASVVFSPPEDRDLYPRRRLADSIIPAWARRGLLEGTPEALQALQERIQREDSAQVRKVLEGDVDSLLRLIADCGLQIQPDDNILPGGALGATETARRHAAAAELGAQARRAGNLYLDDLLESGVVHLVISEQEFYSSLEAAD